MLREENPHAHASPLDTRQTLRRTGREQALVEPLQRPDLATLTGAERFGLLVDRAGTEREHRRLPTRVRQAKRRQTACSEARDDRQPRGLATSLIACRATCPGVRARHHVCITAPTGIGTTWRGGAVGPHACRDGLTALDLRRPRCRHERPMAKGHGRDGKRLTALAKPDVLMRDDGGLAPFREEHRRDVLDIVDERHDRRATMITSPRPVEHWHDALGDSDAGRREA